MPVKSSAFPRYFPEQIAGDRTTFVCEWIMMAASLDACGFETNEGFFNRLFPSD